MALTKYKLGELVELCDRRNSELQYGISDVKGISIQKVFIETKADMTNVSLRPYYLVQPDDFAYVTVTSRNGEKITIAHNNSENTYIVSSSYVVFRVSRKDILLSDYLFMYFNRSEFDRYARFNSWGSARETFSWDEMCDIDIYLPPVNVQKKYVDVYNSMLANQQSYERGLDDLKLVCDGYVDKLKKQKNIMRKLGKFIEKYENKNSNDVFGIDQVRGISNKKEFGQTKADLRGKDFSKFLVIEPNMFAYNPRTDGRDMLVLALNRENSSVLVTWNYNAFRIKNECLNTLAPEYLYMLLCRSEFDRFVRFDSWGSSQELFSWDSLCDVVIPVPPLDVQKSLSEINTTYLNRKNINERLKERIKNMCPILIKGSQEAEI